MNLNNKRDELPVLLSEYRIYFWDVNWDTLIRNRNQYINFIITRLADKGSLAAVQWLKRFCSVEQIAGAVQESRSISESTRRFWKDYAEYIRKCA